MTNETVVIDEALKDVEGTELYETGANENDSRSVGVALGPLDSSFASARAKEQQKVSSPHRHLSKAKRIEILGIGIRFFGY